MSEQFCKTRMAYGSLRSVVECVPAWKFSSSCQILGSDCIVDMVKTCNQAFHGAQPHLMNEFLCNLDNAGIEFLQVQILWRIQVARSQLKIDLEALTVYSNSNPCCAQATDQCRGCSR